MCGKQKRESESKTCNPFTTLEYTTGGGDVIVGGGENYTRKPPVVSPPRPRRPVPPLYIQDWPYKKDVHVLQSHSRSALVLHTCFGKN